MVMVKLGLAYRKFIG